MEIAGWEELYRTGEWGREEVATTLLAETLGNLAPGEAFDLASGAGRHAIYMAERGWTVMAVDGSQNAIQLLEQRAEARGLKIETRVSDLTAPNFEMPTNELDLVLIAYYLQRDLFAKAKAAVRPGGVVIAIAHIPPPGEPWTEMRAAPGELKTFFDEWDVLWEYEGPSRDPAHKHPVAEIVARKPCRRVQASLRVTTERLRLASQLSGLGVIEEQTGTNFKKLTKQEAWPDMP